jgi:hypothetical protein
MRVDASTVWQETSTIDDQSQRLRMPPAYHDEHGSLFLQSME